VLYNDITSEPPWLPIPIQARLTFSPARSVFPSGEDCAEDEVQIAGKAVEADKSTVFFKKERRELLLEFIL
jgi:hypothetical protein